MAHDLEAERGPLVGDGSAHDELDLWIVQDLALAPGPLRPRVPLGERGRQVRLLGEEGGELATAAGDRLDLPVDVPVEPISSAVAPRIAGPPIMRVESLRKVYREGRVEVVADVRLDALAPSGDREARAEPCDTVDEREEHDQTDVVPDRRRVPLQSVDCSLHRPRDRERRERRGPEAGDADTVARSVPPDVTPGRPGGRGQPRLPAACGRRAA